MTPETAALSDDAFLDVGKSFTDPVSGITITTLSVSSTTATIRSTSTPSTAVHPLGPERHRLARPEPRRPARHRRDVHRLRHQYRQRRLPRRELHAPGDAAHHELAEELRRLQRHPEPRRDRLHDPAHHVPRRAARGLHHRHRRDQHHGLHALRLDLGGLQRRPGCAAAAAAGTDVHGHLRSPRFPGAGQWLVGDDRQPDDPGRRRRATSRPRRSAWPCSPAWSARPRLVAASFASTNNNSAPRFGVVVRYQNPQNYYLCYRQVGGSSVLRIGRGIAGPSPAARRPPRSRSARARAGGPPPARPSPSAGRPSRTRGAPPPSPCSARWW